jgi:hypothetical protein
VFLEKVIHVFAKNLMSLFVNGSWMQKGIHDSIYAKKSTTLPLLFYFLFFLLFLFLINPLMEEY